MHSLRLTVPELLQHTNPVFFALLVHNLSDIPSRCFALFVMRVFCAVHRLTLNVLVVVPVLMEMMRLDHSSMCEPFHEEPVVSAVAVMWFMTSGRVIPVKPVAQLEEVMFTVTR